MKEKGSTKRLRAIIMILLLSLVFVQLSDFDSLSIEAEEHGFWRLIKIQVDETEYFNPAPSDYRLRSIEFEEGPSVDLNLGEMSVINVEFTEEADGTKGKYQTFFKWTHPQTTLRAGEEYSILLVAKQEVNTTDLMLGNSIICSHQLLAPPDVYQMPIAAIQGASLTLMNKEFGDSGLNTEKNFEFRVREPDQKKEYGYIFRVEVKSNNAYRRYDYIYEWVDEVYPILQEIRVFINGQLLVTEVPAVIQEGRTLVPLRAILEALGAQLDWDETTRTVTTIKDTTTMILRIGSREAEVNGEIKLMDVGAMIINGRTLVPARFLAENFGATVNWDNDNRIVIIND